MTTEYDPGEDRVRFAVRDKADRVTVLWLTRRLGVRLVLALVKDLSANLKTEPAMEDPAAAESPADPSKSALKAAQVYAQLEARVARKPAEAVRPDDSSPQCLISEVTISQVSTTVMAVIFKAPSHEPVELVLAQNELRQWINNLHTVFMKGEWRDPIWPDWVVHSQSVR